MPEVRLRRLRTDDVEALVSWAGDERFRTQAGWSRRSPAELETFWAAQVGSTDGPVLRLGAESEGELVGYVDLCAEADHTVELGFLIGPSRRWGRGLGTAAAVAGLGRAFARNGVDLVWAEAAVANEASLRALHSAGLGEVGAGEPVEFRGRFGPSRRFELTRSSWEQRPLHP